MADQELKAGSYTKTRDITEPLTIDLLRKYFANIKVTESGCWEWQGKVSTCGYIKREVRGLDVYLHRMFYATYKGPIIDKLVCHHCDNRRCLNPDHMFLGDHKSNMRDMALKGRASSAKTRIGNNMKITATTAVEIFNSKERACDLAEKYKVTMSTIFAIRRGTTWSKSTGKVKMTYKDKVLSDVLKNMSKYWEHRWCSGDEYLVRINMAKLEEGINALLSSAAPSQPVAVPSDEQMLAAFNSAESVIDGLHEVRALLTTANAGKDAEVQS